ncbi:glycosyltransferase family 2 protein [Aquimarina sp. MMG015]|uniref:glycosyltransferase family 2 protein n=1 Tax=unclassified Aquimarina TaxID=2627091 RepID=UPI000E46E283|nr:MULTISPECIES: glycosyltransferase family 2 protein [unclassified Aquimarina]AXT56498.1 glycosyltransferase family 2 protein [Aquimarina sp. AD1]MBQ4803387.1 glycosyltransferase family 2 protein [Aquimarina sp. MMG015]RKN06354.1 glycosyltransferase [Aquimarina sp. AD1]
MNIYIVIPAHNEELLIAKTLESLVSQTFLPKKIVVVNDNSTDNTKTVVLDFINKHSYISLVNTSSSKDHMPGSKVINAFYKGYTSLDDQYDVICKFDADLIFPKNYLATLVKNFKENQKIGMFGGFCYIQKDNNWILENLTNKDHIRGALKAYRKSCFQDIRGLKPAMGWDTIDELLAQYHNWKIKTDQSLKVKHLKPTGNTYNPKAKYKQGEAFYTMRYGLMITLIASMKLAILKKQPKLLLDYLIGFFKAKKSKQPYLVSKVEGDFIRKLRWKKILQKFSKP